MSTLFQLLGSQTIDGAIVEKIGTITFNRFEVLGKDLNWGNAYAELVVLVAPVELHKLSIRSISK